MLSSSARFDIDGVRPNRRGNTATADSRFPCTMLGRGCAAFGAFALGAFPAITA